MEAGHVLLVLLFIWCTPQGTGGVGLRVAAYTTYGVAGLTRYGRHEYVVLIVLRHGSPTSILIRARKHIVIESTTIDVVALSSAAAQLLELLATSYHRRWLHKLDVGWRMQWSTHIALLCPVHIPIRWSSLPVVLAHWLWLSSTFIAIVWELGWLILVCFSWVVHVGVAVDDGAGDRELMLVVHHVIRFSRNILQHVSVANIGVSVWILLARRRNDQWICMVVVASHHLVLRLVSGAGSRVRA